MEAIFGTAYQPYLTRKIPSITVLRTLNVYFDFFKRTRACLEAIAFQRYCYIAETTRSIGIYLFIYVLYVLTNSNNYYVCMCINVSTLEQPIVIVLLSQ